MAYAGFLARLDNTAVADKEERWGAKDKLAVIREKADSIAQVVTTITQVAGRTDLLTTNAAGEAEKAGEHGRRPWWWPGGLPAGRPDGGGDLGHRERGAADAGRGAGRRPADGPVRRGGALRPPRVQKRPPESAPRAGVTSRPGAAARQASAAPGSRPRPLRPRTPPYPGPAARSNGPG